MVFMKNRKLIWRGIVVDENFQINNDDAKYNWCKKEIKKWFLFISWDGPLCKML